tara:strand:+ start:659 stop:979 length:321 start_codon:yes stop_codon:yes gene_type:complete
MGRGIAKVLQVYIFPWLGIGDGEIRHTTSEAMVTYPHCVLGILNNEAKKINYVDHLEGELTFVSRNEYPNGVNFYIDNMGALVIYTDDPTHLNFSIDELGNLTYTT